LQIRAFGLDSVGQDAVTQVAVGVQPIASPLVGVERRDGLDLATPAATLLGRRLDARPSHVGGHGASVRLSVARLAVRLEAIRSTPVSGELSDSQDPATPETLFRFHISIIAGQRLDCVSNTLASRLPFCRRGRHKVSYLGLVCPDLSA